MKVPGKVMVVTGGGSGMGRELVRNLLVRGARVAAIDVSEKNLAETATLVGDHGPSLCTFVLDITDRSAVESLPDQIISRMGAVDGLINNAGIIQPFVRVSDLSYQAIERVFQVNLFGTIYMIKAFLPHLVQRPEAHLVNIASMGGFVPVPGQVIYGASKAAVKLLTEGLASELVATNVSVSVVMPGAVNTNISANSGVISLSSPSKETRQIKMLSAQRAAELIVAGIEADRPRILVGTDAKFMDFFSRLCPVRAAKLIQKKMGALLPP